jgi:hypothetical protein
MAPCMLCRYEEDEERRERFYYTMLGGGGTPPRSACPDVARLVVQQHFNCPSAWCILPLQVCCMLILLSSVDTIFEHRPLTDGMH